MDNKQPECTIIPHPKVYPYIVTRIVPAFYHIILLPNLEDRVLMQIAGFQAQSNDLSTCLVLSENHCAYINDRKTQESQQIPSGGFLVAGMIKTVFDGQELVQNFSDYAQRQSVLKEFIDSHKSEGFMLGDITKGGKDATEEEKTRLAGLNAEGVPTGLTTCTICGDWKGQCLDPSEEFKGKIMTVNCKCENYNRCAKCHGLLYKLKLNANHFNPHDNKIWHTPGFAALSHKCGER